jgi:tRNA A-37 threonylcarbamoyl transferase component Bud32
MTSDPKSHTARQRLPPSEGESASPDKVPAAPSNTPPPMSYPHDVDTAWDSDKRAGIKSEPEPKARASSSGRALPPSPSGRALPPSSSGRALPPTHAMGTHGYSGAPNPHGRFAVGSQFGVYAVGACIGEGGMARVYQAEHAGLRRQVALKVLIDGFARDPDGRERFVREARIAAAIKHPNVVNIFDVGVYEDIPYLVMEFLEGQDLEKLLQAKGALDESLIIDIMVPVVAGLLAVHDAGIVHRDLKPGNIFLARGRYNDLEPKLLDFGISKAQGTEQLQLTASHAFMGTPFYISPEALHGGEMTPLSDQYSLGVVMYECATGVAPFRASSLLELSNLIGSGQYTPATTHKPELSQRLARIIERAMSLDPQDRFKDMREMGCELLTLAGQRTRITWGLSFGDVRFSDIGDIKETVPSRREPRQVPLRRSGVPAAREERKPRVSVPFIGIVLLLFVAGLVAPTVWRRFSRPMVSVPAAPVGGMTAARSTAEGAPTAAAAAPGGVGGGNAGVAAGARPSVPSPTIGSPEPPAVVLVPPKDPGLALASGRDVQLPSRQAAIQGTMRRTARPTASAVRRTATEAEPEWALPPAGGPPHPAKAGDTQFGANEAPILD